MIKEAEKYTLEEGFKWRKPQKNAAQAIEFSISATPEWFENKKPYEVKAYLDSCREFIANRYGEKNLLHWATHYDEKTPHLHILMTPLKKTDKGIKYSSSDFLGGKNGLQELQTEIYNAVGKKYGLNRGVEGSKARHTDQAEFMAKLNKLERNLAEDKRYTQGFKDFLSNKEITFVFENGKKLIMKSGKKSLEKMTEQLIDLESITPYGLEKLAKKMKSHGLEDVKEAFAYQEKHNLKSIIEIPEKQNYISR